MQRRCFHDCKIPALFQTNDRKNRIQLIIFLVSSCLSLVWNLIGNSYSQPALIFTFVAALSGTVCFFSVLITCSVDFYKRIRATESKADKTPGKTFLCAAAAHLILQFAIFAVLIGIFALSPYLRDTVSAAASTENIGLIESFYGQDIATLYRQQAESFAELVNSASEKGYTQPSFALAMIFNLLISYATFLTGCMPRFLSASCGGGILCLRLCSDIFVWELSVLFCVRLSQVWPQLPLPALLSFHSK